MTRFDCLFQFQDHVGRPRCFSTTVSRKQKTEAATGVASTVTQVNASATPPVGESVVRLETFIECISCCF